MIRDIIITASQSLPKLPYDDKEAIKSAPCTDVANATPRAERLLLACLNSKGAECRAVNDRARIGVGCWGVRHGTVLCCVLRQCLEPSLMCFEKLI